MNLTYTLAASGFYLLDLSGTPMYIEVAGGKIYRVNPATLQREAELDRADLVDDNVTGVVRITGRGQA